MNVTATNKATGEVIELPVNNPTEIVEAWRIAQEYDKASTAIKDQLKKLVPTFISERGTSEVINGFQFRMNTIQRMTYDKTVMRRLLDADTFDLMLKPDKPTIDKYLKENLPDISTELRNSMIEDGKPYQVIKLERLDRE